MWIGVRTVRRMRVLLGAVLSLCLLALPGPDRVSAVRSTETTGVLSIWVLGEGATESHVALVDTGRGEVRVPEELVPGEARTGDRVAVTLRSGRATAVRILPGRVRAAAVADGERRALVIITSTTSPAASPTPTPADVAAVMVQVDERYRSYSNNRVSFSADVVQATVATAACNTFSDNIKNASAASGVDTTNYRHVIVLVPQMSCGFAGLGSLGGGSVMVVSPSFNRMVVTHEIGHNLGLEHASTLWCGSSSAPAAFAADWSTSCEKSEYGDNFSPMGSSYPPSPNAPQLLELGWLDPSQIALPATGTVELSPLAGTSGTRTAVLPDPSAEGAFWLEYRTAVGADAEIRNPGQVQVRFQPRVASRLPSIQTALLNTSGSWSDRFFTPGMSRPGQVFTDPTGRLSVTVVSVGATAVLSVVQDPAVLSVAPTGLRATFEGNSMIAEFEAPATGLRVTGYTVTLSDPSGVFETSTLPVSVYTVQSVRPGPFTLTVTATTRDGRTGTASVDLVSPSLPEVRIASLTPTAGGANVRLALSDETRTDVNYTVTVSRPGHADRVVTPWKRSFSLSGLTGGTRWTVSVTAEFGLLRTAPVSRTFVPKKGGLELGRLTRKKDGSSTAVLTVPRARRGDGVARVFVQYPAGAKVVRYRIPRSGRVTVRFAKEVTTATVTVIPRQLTPVTLGSTEP